MSSTTGVQSLLTNVFRPVYTYSGTGFSTSLQLSNIDTLSASNAILYRADIGDSGSNVYVGLNSGNAWSTVRSCSNAIGLGYGAAANIASVSNSVYIGTLAGANSSSNSNTIAIGYNAGQSSTGSSNIFLGTSTGCQVGNNNVYIGNRLTATSTTYTSNQFLVGTSNTVALAADLFEGCVSIGKSDTGMKYITSPFTRFPSLNLDVAGYARVESGLSIGRDPGNAVLDVNGDFRTDDGYGSLRFTHDQATSNSSLTAVSSNNSLFTNIFPNQCGVFSPPLHTSPYTISVPGMTSNGILIAMYVAHSGTNIYFTSNTPGTGGVVLMPSAQTTDAFDTIVWFAPKLF